MRRRNGDEAAEAVETQLLTLVKVRRAFPRRNSASPFIMSMWQQHCANPTNKPDTTRGRQRPRSPLPNRPRLRECGVHMPLNKHAACAVATRTEALPILAEHSGLHGQRCRGGGCSAGGCGKLQVALRRPTTGGAQRQAAQSRDGAGEQERPQHGVRGQTG